LIGLTLEKNVREGNALQQDISTLAQKFLKRNQVIGTVKKLRLFVKDEI
jgi:hypothetical protein